MKDKKSKNVALRECASRLTATPCDDEVMGAIRMSIVEGLKSSGEPRRHAVRLAESYMDNRVRETPGSIEDAVVETISRLKDCGAFDKDES